MNRHGFDYKCIRTSDDFFADLKVAIGVLSVTLAVFGLTVPALVGVALVADPLLDIADVTVSIITGDVAGVVVGTASIFLPDIFEGVLKGGKTALKNTDNLLDGLDEVRKADLLKLLDDQGFKNVDNIKIVDDTLVISADGGVHVVNGVSELLESAKQLAQVQIDEVLSIEKGLRPDPSTYLSQEYINTHLAQFDEGVSIIMTKEQYISYVKGGEYIGIQADGTQFVMPKNYCDDIAEFANGDIGIYEQKLGFEIGHFEESGGLVRIDIGDIDDLNLRMPSGNEAGANSKWMPGGMTDGGVPEAITDLIPNIADNVIITEIE